MNVASVLPPSPSTIVTSLIVTAAPPVGAASSLRIVPMPNMLPAAMPPGMSDRRTRNVSWPSKVVSPLSVTATSLLVSPGAKVTVPVAAV